MRQNLKKIGEVSANKTVNVPINFLSINHQLFVFYENSFPMKYATYSKLTSIINEFRKVYSEFPMQQALVFLEVCQNPEGLTVGQVKERTGLSQSSASRHCRGLTKQMTPSRKGLDLCSFLPSKHDSRSKVLVLNEKGKALEREIESAMSKFST